MAAAACTHAEHPEASRLCSQFNLSRPGPTHDALSTRLEQARALAELLICAGAGDIELNGSVLAAAGFLLSDLIADAQRAAERAWEGHLELQRRVQPG